MNIEFPLLVQIYSSKVSRYKKCQRIVNKVFNTNNLLLLIRPDKHSFHLPRGGIFAVFSGFKAFRMPILAEHNITFVILIL